MSESTTAMPNAWPYCPRCGGYHDTNTTAAQCPTLPMGLGAAYDEAIRTASRPPLTEARVREIVREELDRLARERDLTLSRDPNLYVGPR